MINAQEVGLRCKNFAVEFKVEARRAGPRAASLSVFWAHSAWSWKRQDLVCLNPSIKLDTGLWLA
jgi:hypothetical protein